VSYMSLFVPWNTFHKDVHERELSEWWACAWIFEYSPLRMNGFGSDYEF
jgi:hypothetical protein